LIVDRASELNLVTVEPQHGQPPDRSGRQRVTELAFQEPNLLVEQPVAAKVLAHVL
jgi:hypothetical protein